MQERLGALAVRMRFSMQPGQIPTQLVVQAFNVVRMGLPNRVMLPLNDGQVRLVLIGAILNMRRSGQLRLQHPCRAGASITQGKAHDLVALPVYCPPQPDGLFFEPIKLHISSASTTAKSWGAMGVSALPATSLRTQPKTVL